MCGMWHNGIRFAWKWSNLVCEPAEVYSTIILNRFELSVVFIFLLPSSSSSPVNCAADIWDLVKTRISNISTQTNFATNEQIDDGQPTQMLWTEWCDCSRCLSSLLSCVEITIFFRCCVPPWIHTLTHSHTDTPIHMSNVFAFAIVVVCRVCDLCIGPMWIILKYEYLLLRIRHTANIIPYYIIVLRSNAVWGSTRRCVVQSLIIPPQRQRCCAYEKRKPI